MSHESVKSFLVIALCIGCVDVMVWKWVGFWGVLITPVIIALGGLVVYYLVKWIEK